MSLQIIHSDSMDLLKRLGALAAKPRAAGDAGFSAKVQEATSAAKSLMNEARQPVRVGLVGAFNAGKTRLLEALLGCSGRLNVIDKPATGNLVEFELKQGDVTETTLGNWKVVFMAEVQDAGRILRRLLGEARDLQNRELAQNPAGVELNRLLYEAEFEEGERPRWMKAQEWATQAHAKARANQFKAVAFEVYRLAYTVGQAGEWLGREFSIKEADAISLMSLDYDPHAVFSQDLAQWRFQTPSPPRSGSIEGVSVNELKSLFPIVRKIIVQATLPALIAQPFGGKELDVRLVDCPGAGADGTNFRDTVMCAQELKDVDTVFALLNAKNPGENRQFIDELLRIWGQQAKDRILAVVSRFDQLPHNANESAGKRDELSEGSGPLSAGELLKAIPTLDTMYKAATHTVMDRDVERICFISTLGFLSERLQEERRGLRGLVDKFYERELGFPPKQPRPGLEPWDQTHQPWVCEMGQWAGIAERLSQDAQKESKSLGGLLSDFATDGGITRLHRTLQRHLGQYGQANKLARLMPQHDRMMQVVTDLEAEAEKLPAPPVKSEEKAAPAISKAEAVHWLAQKYESLVAHAETRMYPLVRFRSGAVKTEEILPPLQRGLITDVSRWDEWRLLFRRISRTAPGLVEFVDRENPDLKTREADLKDETRTPVKSDDFKQPFIASLMRLQKVLRDRCLESLRYHSEELQRDLESRLGGSLEVGRLQAACASEGGISIDPFSPVADALGAAWIDPILRETSSATDPRDQETHADYFPLQHGPNKPLYYAWHKPLYQKHSLDLDDRRRHMMYVIRLRQVIIDAALWWLSDVAYDVENAMRTEILERLRKVSDRLRTEADKHPIESATSYDPYNT